MSRRVVFVHTVLSVAPQFTNLALARLLS